MLRTVLERFAESRVECVLGYSRMVNNVASIIALQTATMEEIHGVLRGRPASARDAVLERVRNGRFQVRVAAHNILIVADHSSGLSDRISDREFPLTTLSRVGRDSTVWLSGPGATE